MPGKLERILNSLLKLETLANVPKFLNVSDEVDEKTREELLIIAIEEQRRVYDWISDNYKQVRTRAIVYVGAGLATLTFLYSHPNRNGKTFIPPETDGRIFYFAGLALMLLALAMLLISLRTSFWEFPIEDKVLSKLNFRSKVEYLEYIKERYRDCYKVNVGHCEFRYKMLNFSFPMLILGGIILMVINLFGG